MVCMEFHLLCEKQAEIIISFSLNMPEIVAMFHRDLHLILEKSLMLKAFTVLAIYIYINRDLDTYTG